MIPLQPPPEPQDFDAKVRQPALAALVRLGHNPNNPPPNESFWKTPHTTASGWTRKTLDYWTIARDDLCRSYNKRCAYSCFTIEPIRDPNGRIIASAHSIDHFAPKSLRPAKEAFDWSNLRWCWNVINNKKGDSVIATDPVMLSGMIVEMEEDVHGNWLVVPAQRTGPFSREQVQDAIEKLGLNAIRAVVISRNRMVLDFEGKPRKYSDAEMLDRQPFVFLELRRLGRI